MKNIILSAILATSSLISYSQLLPAGESYWSDETGSNWTPVKDNFGLFVRNTGDFVNVPAGWTTLDPANGHIEINTETIEGDETDTIIIGYNYALDLSNGGPFTYVCEQFYHRDSSRAFINFSLDSVNWHWVEINQIPDGDTLLRFPPLNIPRQFQAPNVWIQLALEVRTTMTNPSNARWIIDDIKFVQLPVVRILPVNLDTILNDKVQLCDGDSIVLRPFVVNPPTNSTFNIKHKWSSLTGSNDSLLIIKASDVVKLGGNSALPGVNPFSNENAMEGEKDSINIEFQVPYEENIFLVTVDSATEKYLVVWRRTEDKGTVRYNVYKETTSGKRFLQSTLISELPVIIDTSSNPLLKPERYVITTIDTCGNEALYAVGKAHRTVRLMVENDPVSGKPKLTWNDYIGFDYDKFYIFRGNTPDVMDLYDSLDYTMAEMNEYIDEDPLIGDNYYRVEIDRGEVLQFNTKANAGPFSRSISNLEDNRQQALSNEPYASKFQLAIFPNPMSHKATIIVENGQHLIQLLDISGKIVFSDTFFGAKYELNREQLESGYYLINITGNNNYRGNLIIK